MEKIYANFVQVSDKGLMGKTKRGNDGFGSTGFSVIKKPKIESRTFESKQTTAQNSCEMLQVVCKKTKR